MKKYLIPSIGAIFVVVIIVLLTLKYISRDTQQRQNLKYEIINKIPTDAALIALTNNLNNLTNKIREKSQIWKWISEIKEMNKLNSLIFSLDSILIKNGIITEKSEVSISFHLLGKNQFLPLLIIKANPVLNESNTEDIIKNHFKTSIKKYDYQNYRISYFDYNQVVYYYIKSNDIICISNSKLLIESIIKQEQKNYSLLNNKTFADLLKSTGKNSDVNLFLNFKYFNQLWQRWFKPTQLLTHISSIKPASWISLDGNFSNDKLFFYGYCDASDSLNFYLKVLNLPSAKNDINIISVIPDDINSFIYLSLPDINEFRRRRMLFMEANGELNTYNYLKECYKKNCKLDFIDSLYNIIIDECCISLKSDANNRNSGYLIFKILNRSSSIENIEYWLNKINQNSGNKVYKESIKLDEDYSIDVYKSPINEIGALLVGDLFGIIKTNFFTFYDEYLVFGETKNDLKDFVYYNILKKTLRYDNLFKKHNELIDNSSVFIFYSNIKKSLQWYPVIFNQNISEVFVQNSDIIKEIDAFILQITKMNNYLYNNVIITYGTSSKANIVNNWESKLDTISLMKPTFVINHNSGETEIFLQDKYNNIYLINKMGRILWKENLPEAIISDIYQIDIFNNKKLQYIFNTRNYIYVIDRNGKEVYPFPIRLKFPATNGIFVDFEDKKIYIACMDKKVYCYNFTGKQPKEWKSPETNYFVSQPIQVFYYANKKYIVLNDSLNLYFLNSSGKSLIKIKETFIMNKNSRIYFDTKTMEKPFFIINDVSGALRYIFTDGTIKKYSFISDISKNHYYMYNDFDGDGLADHIFFDDDKVYVFNFKGKEISSFKIEGFPDFRPNFYSFPARKNKVGLIINQKLYLYDYQGNMPSGFPLKSTSPFSISHALEKFKKYSLITCTPDGFLINYEIKN